MNRLHRLTSCLAVLGMIAFGGIVSAQSPSVNLGEPTDLFQQAEDLRLGRDGPADLERSLEIHSQLAAEGRAVSYVRMSDILNQLGRPEESLAALEAGRDAGSDFARTRLAIGHLNGQFGAVSNPTLGFEYLRDIVRTSDSDLARFNLARAYESGNGTDADVVEAFRIYEELAADGHALSLRRLGDFASNGMFGTPNAEEAAANYRASAEAGMTFSWLLLARLELERGNTEQAIDAYARANGEGLSMAGAELARLHFLEELGPSSDKEFGRNWLETEAESGNLAAATEAMILWERRSRRIDTLDIEGIVAMLDERMRAGDEAATVALARAYRVLRWRIPRARTRHAELVDQFGAQLGERHYVRERLFDIYDPNNHPASRRSAAEIVRDAEGEFYRHGVMGLRATEMTAFVYLLQKELADLGYYNGPATGQNTAATVRATLRFCADSGIYDTCIHGPLTYPASSAIAAALTAAKDE